ncbi:hypothetical protein SRB17_43730 [Streptomyces sp. RB17]|uniref:hypothetical protein n=1 Tax=Streptomyces sp. RB17 TaxID=2585197 RepID=UPI00130953E6|nr:hypothetical protein [Streptomyces sp. RB17]MQY36374.1 hypothetical protein [Streptomyces sp. RB17]
MASPDPVSLWGGAVPVPGHRRCPCMNRLDPAHGLDRLERIDRLDRKRRAGRPAQADRAREPIYARLVAEWRAQGRTVPAEPDAPPAAHPAPGRA